MDKETLKKYLEEGLSNKQIAKITNKGKSTVGYWVNKYGLNEYLKYNKPEYSDINYFSKIDTREKAYILGMLLGDSCLTDDSMTISLSLKDTEILEFIKSEINCNIRNSYILDKKRKIFPNTTISIGNKTIINDLKKLFGGNLKESRHIPIIPQKFERYLLQGFFDAEGCVTWGKRKDRDKVWQKISFTSQYRMLEGIQNILYKNGIPAKLKPKSDNSNCFVIEFSNKKSVLEFLDIIYPNDDFIVLKRKYEKAQALRLELGEFGES